MAEMLKNPFRGSGMPGLTDALMGVRAEDDATAARALFGRCPAADVTPLVALDDLAGELGLGAVFAKDERGRMELGSFKALGAAFAIAKMAAARGGGEDLSGALAGETFVCASAGNHGLSVAAGAQVFGARAVIYLAETVPEVFAGRLRANGAEVVREGGDYEASMAAAMAAAGARGWRLLSDSSWPGYLEPARDVMEGYLVMAAEAGEQMPEPPSHIFLQAGVGGLAAACTLTARRLWGEAATVVIVEPEFAPALKASIAAGRLVVAPGPVSAMGRLDCKEASLLALDALAREADAFMTVSEADAAAATELLARYGMRSTPSGTAGLAGVLAAQREGDAGLDERSRVLIYVSEGPEDE